MSSRNEVMELYKKEREYEQSVFGDYSEIKSLNVASFMILLEKYLAKVKSAYCGKWDRELPPWLLACKEFDNNQSAPVEVYEHLITIMTLAGAALEAYTKIDPNEWRSNPENDRKKWEE
jgi:hypothetical protein